MPQTIEGFHWLLAAAGSGGPPTWCRWWAWVPTTDFYQTDFLWTQDTSTNRTFLCLCAGGKAAPLTELRILSFHSASIIALVIPPAEMSVCRNRAPVRPVGVITPWALSSLPGPGRAYEKVSQ